MWWMHTVKHAACVEGHLRAQTCSLTILFGLEARHVWHIGISHRQVVARCGSLSHCTARLMRPGLLELA